MIVRRVMSELKLRPTKRATDRAAKTPIGRFIPLNPRDGGALALPGEAQRMGLKAHSLMLRLRPG